MKRLPIRNVLFCSAFWQNSNSKSSDAKPESVPLRRTDLPVYPEETNVVESATESNAVIMNAVKSFRVEACKVARSAKSVSDKCSQIFNIGVAHFRSSYSNALDYLHEDKNLLPRVGALGGGVLVGYIFGLRKGFIKRIIYTTSGGLGATAICYPKEASEYFQTSLHQSKRYFTIGYHFMNGVTKDFTGYELPGLPLKTINEQETKKSDEKSE